jgi:hypothetical protein
MSKSKPRSRVDSTKPAMSLRKSGPVQTKKEDKFLLESHQQHLGLYKRIAGSLEVDSSYVSKVAGGTRTSEPVKRRLMDELGTQRTKVCKKTPARSR